MKIRIRKEIRPKRPAYNRLIVAIESNGGGIGYRGDSSPEIKTSDSTETVSSGFNRHFNDIMRQTSSGGSSSADRLEIEIIQGQLPSRTMCSEKQLTEQEESAQSGLMLLASLPFSQPETTTVPRFLPSLTFPSNHQSNYLYSYQHPMATSLDERFDQQHPICSLRPSPITSMHGFYDYHTSGFFPNSTAISSNFLIQKNLIA